MKKIYSVMEFLDNDIFARTTIEVWVDYWIKVFNHDPTPRRDIKRVLNEE